jgi:hypothetical protein
VAGYTGFKLKGAMHIQKFGILAVTFLAISHSGVDEGGISRLETIKRKNSNDDYRYSNSIHD